MKSSRAGFLGLCVVVIFIPFVPAAGTDPLSDSSASAGPMFDVALVGCVSIYSSESAPNLRCAPYPRDSNASLRIAVRVEPGVQVKLLVNHRLVATSKAWKSDRRFRPLFLQPGTFMVEVKVGSGAKEGRWQLELTEPESLDYRPKLDRLMTERRLAEARQLLRERLSKPRSNDSGFVLADLARVASKEEHPHEAIEWCRKAMAAHHQVGRTSGEGEAASLLSRYAMDDGDFQTAREALEVVSPLLPRAGTEAQYRVAYARGLLAQRLGDYRTAQAQVDLAVDLAARTRMRGNLPFAKERRALVELDLGHFKEATDVLKLLADESSDRDLCDRASVWTNLGWARLMAREASEDTGDPAPALRTARALYETKGLSCSQSSPQETLLLNSHLNIALAAIQAGHWREARQELSRVRGQPEDKVSPTPQQRLWSIDLEAQLAIAEGRPQHALELYGKLQERAAVARSPDGRFRALLGKARARIAAGDRPDALVALEEADRVVTDQLASIPLQGEGREAFMAQRASAAKLMVQLLVDERGADAALRFVRRVRPRLLRELMLRERLSQLKPKERAEWQARLEKVQAIQREREEQVDLQSALGSFDRSEIEETDLDRRSKAAGRDLDALLTGLPRLTDPTPETLAPLGPHEVLLAYYPLPKGWVGFAFDARGVEHRKLSLPASTDVEFRSRCLLAPFADKIRGATRVRVLPYGPLWAIDFHALPFAGEPLLAHRSVVYSLDLPAASSARPVERRTAVLISDPLGNLWAARQESDAVERSILQWPGEGKPFRLDGLRATAAAVRLAFGGASFVHYAGHGLFGGGGWGSTLPLAGDSRLTVDDILTLERAPTWVVLSACDAGRSSEKAPGEGIGLAQALLVAGAQAVIAAPSPVGDESARQLVRELYKTLTPTSDPAAELRRAELEIRRRNVTADWKSFRVLIP